MLTFEFAALLLGLRLGHDVAHLKLSHVLQPLSRIAEGTLDGSLLPELLRSGCFVGKTDMLHEVVMQLTGDLQTAEPVSHHGLQSFGPDGGLPATWGDWERGGVILYGSTG